MPKHPIYTALLSDDARAAIGQVHDSGKPALAMLEEEGFRYDGYIDIFDDGPAVSIRTEQLRTVREARKAILGAVMRPGSGDPAIFARVLGNLFNATYADIEAPGGPVLIEAGGRACRGYAARKDGTY